MKKTGRSVAAAAGLAVALALGTVAGPAVTALADETTPEVTTQSAPNKVDVQREGWWQGWTGKWHFGYSWVLHPEVDYIWPYGRCDLCLAPTKGDCKPGGDDKPEQQQGFITYECVNPDDARDFTHTDVRGDVIDGEMTITEVPTPEQYEGYDFKGWEVCGGDPVFADQLRGTKVPAYTVIRAVYEATVVPVPETHKVTFDYQAEGFADEVVEVKNGGTVAKPDDPTRDGYTFGGWHTEPECENAYSFGDTPVTEDITLYAKWVAESEEPGTDPDEPGTDPDNPDTDPDVPGTDEPGTDEPGADTEQPAGDQGTPGTDDVDQPADTVDPADDPAGEDAIPNTGDATVLVSGIAAAGATLAGAGVFLKRRR